MQKLILYSPRLHHESSHSQIKGTMSRLSRTFQMERCDVLRHRTAVTKRQAQGMSNVNSRGHTILPKAPVALGTRENLAQSVVST